MVIYMKPRPPSQATDDSKTRISPQKIKQKEKTETLQAREKSFSW